MYKIEDKNHVQHPVAENSYLVIKELCKKKDLHISIDVNLPQYSSFGNVPLTDLLRLIFIQAQEGYLPVVEQYTNKFFRFSEINLWQYKKKLDSKGLSFSDKFLFHQLLINLFIRAFLQTDDFRFLNTGLKLNNVLRISFSSSLILRSVNKPALQLADINNMFLHDKTRI